MKNSKIRASKKPDPQFQGIDAPLMKGDLLLLPLGILTTVSIFIIVSQFPNIFQSTSVFPLLTIATFGFLYAYKTFRRRNQFLLTRIMAGILAALLFLVLLLTLFFTSGSETCSGFFGTQTDCIELQHMALLFLLFNPFVGTLLGVSSLIGIISILLKGRK